MLLSTFGRTMIPRYPEGTRKTTILTGTSGLLLGVVSEGPPTKWETGKSVLPPEGASHPDSSTSVLPLSNRLLVSASQDGKLIIWDSYTTNKVEVMSEAGWGWAAGPAWFLTLGTALPP